MAVGRGQRDRQEEASPNLLPRPTDNKSSASLTIKDYENIYLFRRVDVVLSAVVPEEIQDGGRLRIRRMENGSSELVKFIDVKMDRVPGRTNRDVNFFTQVLYFSPSIGTLDQNGKGVQYLGEQRIPFALELVHGNGMVRRLDCVVAGPNVSEEDNKQLAETWDQQTLGGSAQSEATSTESSLIITRDD